METTELPHYLTLKEGHDENMHMLSSDTLVLNGYYYHSEEKMNENTKLNKTCTTPSPEQNLDFDLELKMFSKNISFTNLFKLETKINN